MKTKQFFSVVALVAGMCAMTSCGGSSKQVANQAPAYRAAEAVNPFASGVYETPGFEPDTEEYFAALGIANGPSTRMDVLQLSALTNAQNVVRHKLKHAYKGIVSDYSNYIGNNAGSDAQVHVERAGDQIIDAVVNDTQAQSLKFSGVDAKGHVNCYCGIRIYKKQLADKIADVVSEDEELKIRFKEQEFRKYMQEKFKEYKESK